MTEPKASGETEHDGVINWNAALRAALRVVNAQPVSEAEVEAAYQKVLHGPGRDYADRNTIRAALEAAAKVRAGG